MILNLLLILLLPFSQIDESHWEYQFEKQGVKVYTKAIAGSGFKAFKGEAVFEAEAGKIIHQLFEITSYPLWCYRTTSAMVIKQDSNKVYYRYVSETPPVIKNREAYFYNELLPDDGSGTRIIALGTYSSEEPVPTGFIRMPFSKGCWKLKPLSEHKPLVTFEMQADPGGLIPSWLANMASSDSPWITMTNLQKILSEN